MSKLDFSVDKIETTDNKKDSIDNLQDTQSYTSLKGLRDLFKYIYPVNSIYISYSHTYPGDLFGGTWERIENTFLWCLDANGDIGSTGGEATHTLTVDEMPSHKHYLFSSRSMTITDNKDDYVRTWTVDGTDYPYAIKTSDVVADYGLSDTKGGSQPHNNMPPFTEVSAWRRTEL